MMAWICNLGAMVDLGSFYSVRRPTLTGQIVSLPAGGGPVTDTATATISPFAMTFPGTASTPAGTMSLLIQDPTSPTSGGGDFFRWRDDPLPASPAPLASYTIPSVDTTFTIAQLQDLINAQLPLPIALDRSTVVGVSFATSGAVILKLVAITSLSIATAPPNLAFTAQGSVTFDSFGLVSSSVSCTLSATLSILPSHDATNLTRVLHVSAISPSFKVVGLEPNVVGILQGTIADQAAQQLEDRLNGFIHGALGPAAAKSGQQLTTTAVASAQRVVVGAGGLTIAIVLADLRGAALIPLVVPVSIQVMVAPSPVGRSGKVTPYVVTVTNAASGKGVAGASVTLVTFDATHNTLGNYLFD
jgi:hypothetical protein